MIFSRTIITMLGLVTLIFFGCQSTEEKKVNKTPGIYHIRFELGNYWAGREDEIYFDYDSTQTVQQIHYYKYDDGDSIVFNRSYEVSSGKMDSVFNYAVDAIRNNDLFNVDKYEPKDVNTLRLEIIANERMLASSYNNVLKPSLISPEFGLLVKMINSCVGDSTFVK